MGMMGLGMGEEVVRRILFSEIPFAYFIYILQRVRWTNLRMSSSCVMCQLHSNCLSIYLYNLPVFNNVSDLIRAISEMTSSRSAAKPRGCQIFIAEKPTATNPIEKGRMSVNPASGLQKRSALVLYASETGNAQDVAEELGDLAERLHFVTQVSEMNNFKPVALPPFPSYTNMD